MKAEVDFEGGPCLYVELVPRRAVFGSVQTESERECAALVFEYEATDAPFVDAIMQQLHASWTFPVVAIDQGVLSIVYAVRPVPAACLTGVANAGACAIPGIPAVARIRALSRAGLIGHEVPEPFMKLYNKQHKYVLLVTEPLREMRRPIMTFLMTELYQ